MRLRIVTSHCDKIPICKHTEDGIAEIFERAPKDGILVERYDELGVLISGNRNQGIQAPHRTNAIKQWVDGFDKILFLDSDNSISYSALSGLLSRNLPLVGAAYKYRSFFVGKYVAGTFAPNGLVAERVNDTTTGLVECGWIGAGCMLASAEIFNAMDYPWFQSLTVSYGKEGVACTTELGEDLSFCLKAKQVGVKIYLDCDNQSEHKLDVQL